MEKPKFTIPMFEKEKSRIPTFGNAKIHNSNAWKRKSLEFQCLEFPKFLIPMFGKAHTRKF